jgi:hypothetical protein
MFLARSENDLQYSVCNLNNTAAEFSMKITSEETKVMAFRGPEQVRSNTIRETWSNYKL